MKVLGYMVDWDKFKVGDKVYYDGFYWDCVTPHIDRNVLGTILEDLNDNGKMKVDFDGNIQTVYRCELKYKKPIPIHKILEEATKQMYPYGKI
jgi:hypothetical protein